MSPIYTEPRDIRPAEFMSSSDLNALSDDILSLFQGAAARVSNPPEMLANGTDTQLSYGHTVFDRGLRAPDETDGLTLTDEGVWLVGQQMMWPVSTSCSYISYLRRNLRSAQGPGRYFATFDGLSGAAWSQIQSANCIAAPMYGYAGDVISGWANQYGTPAKNFPTDDSAYAQTLSPVLWGARLASGRTKETWTAPKRTASSPWLSTDVPTDAQLNQQLRDNPRFLRSRPIAVVGGSYYDTLGTLTANTWVTNTLPIRPITDPYGMFDPAHPGRLTIPRTGVYLIVGLWGFEYNALKARGARLRLNGSTIIGYSYTANAGNARGMVLGARAFTAGDYVEMQQYSQVAVASSAHPNYGYPLIAAIHISDTATPPTWVAPPRFNRLDASYISTVLNAFGDNLAFLYGPPCVVATRSANVAIGAGAWTTISYNATDLVNNIGNSFHNPGSAAGTFTFPSDGVYLVFGHQQFVNAPVVNAYGVRVLHEGTAVMAVQSYRGIPGSIDSIIPFITAFRAKAGQTFQVQGIAQAAGTIGATSWVGAVRVAA